MPRHLSACFDVFLNEGVTHDDVFQLMCRELGRTDAEAVDNRMEGNYFSFSMDCNVSYDFQGRFDKFCAEVGKLSDEPFTAYCTYDTGPSGQTDVHKVWGASEAAVFAYKQAEAISSIALTAQKFTSAAGQHTVGKLSHELCVDDSLSGVTFLMAGDGPVAEPVVSVCLAYVNDLEVRKAILIQARMLASLIASAKGNVQALVVNEKSALPTSLELSNEQVARVAIGPGKWEMVELADQGHFPKIFQFQDASAGRQAEVHMDAGRVMYHEVSNLREPALRERG